MKVRATNVSQPTRICWKGRYETTGIFKSPVEGPIYLDIESVTGDTIADRRVHGGAHKACYLFSTQHYPYWQALYPHLEWNWGMFGENLSIDGMDENQWYIGDILKIGQATVQVSMPREPCYKLGIRFENQKILKEFIAFGYPGTYVRVLHPGHVQAGDPVEVLNKAGATLTVRQCFELYYDKQKSQEILSMALNNSALPSYKRDYLRKFTS